MAIDIVARGMVEASSKELNERIDDVEKRIPGFKYDAENEALEIVYDK